MPQENLARLLDALTEASVYVIEERTHRLLYCNRRCREAGGGKAVPGALCHEVWPQLCGNCPLKALKDRGDVHLVCHDPLLHASVDLTANRIVWDGVAAAVVTATPHRLTMEEEQGLDQISQMYAQSLVTVFGECIIADLTHDTYVSCQQDLLWTDIPRRDHFSQVNRSYGEQLVHPEDLPLFEEAFTREAMLRLFGRGERRIVRRLRRRVDGGAYHMVEFTAAHLPSQDGACWCVLVFRDVHREFLRRQRRELEINQLATAAREAYQMLIAVNLTQNTYHLLEYDRAQMARPAETGNFDDLLAQELRTVRPDCREEFQRKFLRENLLAAYASGRRMVSMEAPHLGEDGAYHWYFTQVVRVDSPETDDVLEITLSRNIDAVRRQQEEALEKERRAKQLLEDALAKAEKANSAKSDFLSKMSHDIRTPLNAILGMAELAQLHVDDPARTRDYLDKIRSSGAHLLGLVGEVLDVSKIESGAVALEETAFEVRVLAEEAASLVRLPVAQRSQTLTVTLPPDLHGAVRGDARRLRQVLVNILENASKYTPEGGHIAFSVQKAPQEQENTGTYRFVIEDDGIGMKPEYLGHIFDPFSRADDSRTGKVGGTGLGMTIVKNLVAMMHGDIQVESEYGKGSRFTVTLCLPQCGAPDAPVVGAGDPEDLRAFAGLRVLLVEDNELNRQIATEMLELLGVRVETAEDGRQAVEAVLAHPPLYYDMVFMDVRMPVMNGYEATRRIRDSGLPRIEELPIIAMTADAFAEDIRRARKAGMTGHLPKPISIDQLKKALGHCVAWKEARRGEP